MTITRRGFLKALMAVAAAPAVSSLMKVDEVLALEESMMTPAVAALRQLTSFDFDAAVPGEWIHFAAVKTDKDLCFYVNGIRYDEVSGLSFNIRGQNAEFFVGDPKDYRYASLMITEKAIPEKDFTFETHLQKLANAPNGSFGGMIDELKITTNS